MRGEKGKAAEREQYREALKRLGCILTQRQTIGDLEEEGAAGRRLGLKSSTTINSLTCRSKSAEKGGLSSEGILYPSCSPGDQRNKKKSRKGKKGRGKLTPDERREFFKQLNEINLRKRITNCKGEQQNE